MHVKKFVIVKQINNDITRQHAAKCSDEVGNITLIYNGVKTYFHVTI